MSLVVSSTTDSQESVNLAAGLAADAAVEAPPEETPVPEPEGASAPKPEPAKPETPPEQPEEGEEEEEKPEEEDKARPSARKGRYERRIDRLEQQLAYERKIRELTEQLKGVPREQRQQRAAEPQPDLRPEPGAEPYEDHIVKLAEWGTREQWRQIQQEELNRQRAVEQQQQAETWQSHVDQARAAHEDFDDVLAGTQHVILSKELQDAIATSEDGASLAYELAKQPQELERIAKLPPLAAVRELGKFEAMITAGNGNGKAPVQKPAVSRAPEPIEPVTRGGPMSTKPYDELPYQEYKRRRERDIAAAKAR
jgi:hypothetical protein